MLRPQNWTNFGRRGIQPSCLGDRSACLDSLIGLRIGFTIITFPRWECSFLKSHINCFCYNVGRSSDICTMESQVSEIKAGNGTIMNLIYGKGMKRWANKYYSWEPTKHARLRSVRLKYEESLNVAKVIIFLSDNLLNGCTFLQSIILFSWFCFSR